MNEQPKWYRDPVWQTVGTFIGLAALAFSVWFFWLGREAKALTVTILAETPLVNIASEAGGLSDLTVLYKGEPAGNVSLIQVKIENSGNRAIRVEDFTTPLSFGFGEGFAVIDAAIIDVEPKDLGLAVIVVDGRAEVLPLLLNSDDRAVLRFLVVNKLDPQGITSQRAGLEASARIVDVKTVRVQNALDEVPAMWFDSLVSGLMILLGALSSLLLVVNVINRMLRAQKNFRIANRQGG